MMNPMQAMPQQAPMGGQPPMGPMGGPPMGGPPMGGAQGGFSMPARGVNLFKIQEQLKDMPQQAVMAYANGQNPDLVPPYIALGEMERRTRAAKNAQPSQSPQGTVKDNLEQQIKQAAGLASLAGQKQQQAQQQQMSQSLQTPGPVPENVPSPEDQAEPPMMMAGGGLATLPMNPRMTNYRDGGIVGYAEGEVVETPYIGYRSPRRQEMVIENPDVDENGNPRGRDERAAILAKNAMIARQQAEAEKTQTAQQAEKLRPTEAGIEAISQFSKPRRTEGSMGAPVPAQAAPAVMPTAPQAAPAAMPVNPPFDPSKPAVGSFNLAPERLQGTLAAIQRIADPQERERAMQAFTSQSGLAAPSAAPGGIAGLPSAASSQQSPFAAEYQKEIASSRALQDRIAAPLPPPTAEQQAAMNMPVEQDYFKRLQELATKQGAGDRQTAEDIQSQRRMDLYQSLIAAGEATRGQRGLGALFGGMGASLGKSSAARAGEEAKLRTGAIDREALLEKAQYELRGLERARAEGNREKMLKHREELLKLERELASNRLQGLANVTGAEMGADTRAAIAAARGEQAGDTARSAAVKRAEDAYNNDAEVKQISEQLKSPIFALGTTPAIKAQKDAMEKRREEIRRDKYRQQSITMDEAPGAASASGTPTKFVYDPTTGKAVPK